MSWLAPAPVVTVVVPAHDADSTVARTIQSLRAQEFDAWEAVVVDDGSTDGTAAAVVRAAGGDRRVRVIRQANRGLAAARNRGLAEARGRLVLFLDADDWIGPSMLARTASPLLEKPALAAVHCGWQRVADDGRVLETEFAQELGDLFDAFAQRCAFPVHACLVRTDVVRACGGFDERLFLLEDWDLWLRIARTGARFEREHRPLASYRWRAGSMSDDSEGMLRASLDRIAIGHGRDVRVPADALHAAGRNPARASEPAYTQLCWWAGLRLGRGRDAVDLVPLPPAPCPTLDPRLAARLLLRSAALALGRSADGWLPIWSSLRPRAASFLDAVEERSRAPRLAARALHAADALALGTATEADTAVGETRRIEVDVVRPIPDFDFPPRTSRALFAVTRGAERVGDVGLPVCDARVRADVLADAIAARLGWSLLERVIARRTAHETADPVTQPVEPWTRFLRALYGVEDRAADWFYDPDAADETVLPPARAGDGVDVALALAPLEGAAESIEVRLAGATIGAIEPPAGDSPIPESALRAAVTYAGGLELALIAAREALVGQPDEGHELRERLAQRAATAKGPIARARRASPFALAIPRHRPGPIDSPASRRAALPEAAVRECAAAFPAFGESLVAGDGEGAVYLPDLRPRPAETWAGAGEFVDAPAERLPILLYHRVADDAPGDRWTLRPDTFEAQLRWLADRGFRAIGLAELWRARHGHRLPARSVVLTFDDGTEDFAAEAWPRIREHGFAASLFVVTGFAGGASRWDAGRAEPRRLLDWRAIERLSGEGVEIGSHGTSHAPLTALHPEEIARECLTSRHAIAERLGSAPVAIAYPYGDFDPIVEHLAGACGYLLGLTADPRAMTAADPLLALPRIEVSGDEPLSAFAARFEEAA